MLSLKEYIKIFDNINDDDYIYNSPDGLSIKDKDNKKLSLSYWDDTAHAFIYSINLDSFLISKAGYSHFDFFELMSSQSNKTKSTLKKFDNLYELLYDADGYLDIDMDLFRRDEDEDYDSWAQNNEKINSRFKLGRFWIHNEILYISWWDELISIEFDKYNRSLINELKNNIKKFGKFDIVYYMQNDGKLILFDNKINKNQKEISSSKERKQILKIQQAIHLADQKEKNNFFKEFKRHRDSNNQQKYYNHTKSKTEAEWRNIKYQGDSLIDKEKNRITD